MSSPTIGKTLKSVTGVSSPLDIKTVKLGDYVGKLIRILAAPEVETQFGKSLMLSFQLPDSNVRYKAYTKSAMMRETLIAVDNANAFPILATVRQTESKTPGKSGAIYLESYGE